MSYSILRNVKFAIERETTQGDAVVPQDGNSFIQLLQEGAEMSPSRESLERELLGLGLSTVKPRVGLKSLEGNVSVEMKAGATEGAEPEFGLLMESLLGSKRSVVAHTSGTDHTTSIIYMLNDDEEDYEVGDVVVVKEEGAYHTSPIKAVNAGNIELELAAETAFSNGVVVAALVTYVPENTGHPSFSAYRYVEDERRMEGTGCVATSLSLDSFETGQTASFSLGFEGLDYNEELVATPPAAIYDSSLPPIILDACIWQDGVKISVNTFSLSIENTLGFIQDTCQGKIASRVTARSITGSINPYKESDDISNFNKFNANESFSLFVTAHNATDDGEYKEVVSFYLPQVTITEMGEAEQDGVLQEELSFTATVEDQSDKEIYISFS